MNGNLQLDHPGQRPLADHDIVQHHPSRDGFSMPMDMRLKHESLIENKVIRKYPFERGVQVLQPDLGQKSQSAHVDAEDGNASFPGKSRSS